MPRCFRPDVEPYWHAYLNATVHKTGTAREKVMVILGFLAHALKARIRHVSPLKDAVAKKPLSYKSLQEEMVRHYLNTATQDFRKKLRVVSSRYSNVSRGTKTIWVGNDLAFTYTSVISIDALDSPLLESLVGSSVQQQPQAKKLRSYRTVQSTTTNGIHCEVVKEGIVVLLCLRVKSPLEFSTRQETLRTWKYQFSECFTTRNNRHGRY